MIDRLIAAALDQLVKLGDWLSDNFRLWRDKRSTREKP